MTAAIDLEAHLDDIHKMVVQMLPPELLDLTDIATCRQTIGGFLEQMPAPELDPSVAISEEMVPGHDGDPDVRVKVYRPADLTASAPALLWIHGGGMVLLDADGDDAHCVRRAAEQGCVVVSVDYRLAPETPAPGLVNDCYAALSWLASNADDLGVDADRIMIGGASAGGGLAAGLALFARDQGGPAIAGQMLVYPMLDHRNETPSSHAITDPRVWNRQSNLLAWEAYLGGGEPTPYSSPSIAEDLSGLPPAYINVGTLDMFLDEDIAYAQAMLRAGVPVDLHVYEGAFHASNNFVADHPTSVRWREGEDAFMARIMNG
ncbi:MAG: alpha/beta hydrolase [Actinomycetota bacterium]